MKFEYDARIDQGRMRPYNEDAAVLLPRYGFFAVSDGMGGLLYGKETSRFVVEWLSMVIENDAKELEQLPQEQRMEAAQHALLARVRQLNEYIYKRGNAQGRAVYGATLAAAWVIGEQVLFVNVGDSRGYQMIGEELAQRSEDHNVAAILVEIGQLTAEQAKEHPTSCQLTQFMGCEPGELFPAAHIFGAPAGSRLLLCSDGLYGMIPEQQLAELMQGEPGDCCEKLIDAANEAGGRDNISAVLVVCCEGEPEDAQPIVLYAKDEEQPEQTAPEQPEDPAPEQPEDPTPEEQPEQIEPVPPADDDGAEEAPGEA